MTEYVLIGVVALAGLLYAGGAMLLSRLLAPRGVDTTRKFDSYESGEQVIGSARVQFRMGYYMLALVFLVFDVEAVFLFPALVQLRGAQGGEPGAPGVGLIWSELAAFIGVVAFALIYARRKEALEWK